MIEKTPDQARSKKFIRGVYNTATILAISLALTSCDENPQEQYERQLEKVQQLEHKYLQQCEDYRRVAIQENIQQDLKNEGASSTINKDILYSQNRAKEQKKKIEETKDELREAQEELLRIKEETNVGQTNEERLDERLNAEEFDYVLEEYKRSRKAQ